MTTPTTTTTSNTIGTAPGRTPLGRGRVSLGLAAGAALIASMTGSVVSNADRGDDQRPAAVTEPQRERAAELAQVARWAEETGLTGLSPAWLSPIDQAAGAGDCLDRALVTRC
jgi:hypothetical protein